MHDPRPERFLRTAVVLGALAVLLVPAARGQSAWFGFLPLWLLGILAVTIGAASVTTSARVGPAKATLNLGDPK